ncbi:pantoate--beta-alanine ligase [Coxiella burnetii]|uniref:Pantothenate synthetase n=4 Tax=Coxiella burnetii TaxID=777 RepID=PANC_COXBU|nr:pantoate--beta-alanine ligase [Coxiella burnetii]NP_819461.1 pantoate--beta-alanine ligase [Coxiella burnetii RSA 493]A9NBP1.1 RecName: Full=Pantothenate synthetase; Short=PS; AltName: Full=Pantoate--beta-alanine ligase; AltName: Full=Pantoate-activating enzyme [Coxiella burnetii RSA 331]B6J1Q4.1 RecName: Full=Pantothenate synthetase; Short=PS; AltName: Full=Pantoate--beta-alanine ligase; AltName: Full=Pantoate-activating enzyme [Coxiella burnetii CbuG_Q212]B6J9H9.1 RecName: Full=Pantothenat
MTKVIEALSDWQSIRKTINDLSVGFVPTMGNLHAGHLSLLERSKCENTITVLSLFINPTQFNDKNDFKNYPRTLAQDIAMAEENGIDYVLAPTDDALYPDQYAYKITNSTINNQEAEFRPRHFDGVLTVVMKLLLLVKPTRAYFGEKDYQQLQLVKGLAEAFFLDTEIIGCKIVRNEFGLPLSSRNRRLTEDQYQLAQRFSEIFHSDLSCDEIKNALIQEGIIVDYIEDYNERRFAAVHVGDIRLIDNIPFAKDKKC